MVTSHLELVIQQQPSTELTLPGGNINKSSVGVDSCYSCIVVFASFWCQMVIGGFIFSSAHFMSAITDEFHTTLAAASVITSLLGGFVLLVGPFVGALANQFGFRFATLTGSAIAAIGIGFSYLAPSLLVLYITHGVIAGIGCGMIYVSAIVVVGFYFLKWRTLAVCLAVCGSSAGGVVFEQLYKLTTAEYGWRNTLWIETGMLLSCAVAALTFRAMPPVAVTSSVTSGMSLIGSIGQIKTSLVNVKKTYVKFFDFSLLRSPTLLTLMLSGSLTMGAVLVPFAYLIDYSTSRGVDLDTVKVLLMTIGTASVGGRLACGIIGSFEKCDTLWISSITITLGGLALMCISLSVSAPFQLICCIFFGIATASFFALRPIIVGNLLGMSKLTDSYGLLTFAQGLSVMAGPPLAGYLKEATSSYDTVFYFSGALMFLSGVVLFPLPCINRREKRKALDKKQAWSQQVAAAREAAREAARSRAED